MAIAKAWCQVFFPSVIAFLAILLLAMRVAFVGPFHRSLVYVVEERDVSAQRRERSPSLPAELFDKSKKIDPVA